ncbi:MAG TPA: ExbD/TolR family protein [Steroidobacteraceae bacterium]|nr:ExbD/TolR family protein [Steroidobacteraceae bacterium]
MANQLTRGRRIMGEINVVPYIDVMLVLLIIFMVTAPLLAEGVKVELPRAAAEPLGREFAKDTTPLVLSIDRENRMYLNQGGDPHQVLDEAGAQERAAAVLRRRPDLPVVVKADYRIDYGRVMADMVVLQSAVARKVGLATQPLPAERNRG